ncbi:hypothetical protein VST7929_03047 [Vibrio stylophorae]|uniref:HTH cro/C1-type domain-containing protein n=1 Tax=Vibrio stylophorae TaxID=659351 RepID=A0ABM8ZYQ6_9VIBR|nr:2TM domain-containing protein [Vibrio stylophorae]CAH0535473.1 hypothetical protein VST7929_03047 [Vibrio stylophorae]
MLIRKLRLQRGWSQDQLATFCDVSVRTIQRIERGEKPGLDTCNALAAVFEIDVEQLQQEIAMHHYINNDTTTPKHTNETRHDTDRSASKEELEMREEVRKLKKFYAKVLCYLAVMTLLLIINLITDPSYLWVVWPALGWGIGIVCYGISTYRIFDFFGDEWEKKQVEKRLKRKL